MPTSPHQTNPSGECRFDDGQWALEYGLSEAAAEAFSFLYALSPHILARVPHYCVSIATHLTIGGAGMFVSDALTRKGTDVITTNPTNSVGNVARILKGKGVGAVVVVDEAGNLVGIISERDVIHGIAMHGDRSLHMSVQELMTDDVITCQRDNTINEAMKLMVNHAFRHLPVVEDGDLVGLVSISDIVKMRIRDLESKIAETKIYDGQN